MPALFAADTVAVPIEPPAVTGIAQTNGRSACRASFRTILKARAFQ